MSSASEVVVLADPISPWNDDNHISEAAQLSISVLVTVSISTVRTGQDGARPAARPGAPGRV